MSERWVDAAIGETREALVDNGRVIALRVVRPHEARPRWGETYAARVTRVDKRRRGAFLDLGAGEAFLPLEADGRVRKGRTRVALTEGMAIVVAITREAAREKSAVAALLDAPHPGGAPARLDRHDSDIALDDAKPADAATRARIDAAIEDALARTAPIPGGGALTIEPTAALVAIDVDAGARQGGGDADKFTLDLNLAAAREAARQIRLRGLGGVIAIDFVNMRRQADARVLEAAAKEAFAGDPWGVRMAPLSRFGLMELQRAQMQTPLHELLCDADGALSVETIALQALRAIEREGRASTGRKIAAQLAPDVFAWLEAAPVPWRAALTNIIGPRFTVEAKPGAPRARVDVRAL